MADEPENLTLVMLREIRAEQRHQADMLGKLTDVVTQIAITQNHHSEVLARHSAILEHHSEILAHHSEILANQSKKLDNIEETQKSAGARLNVIDGRLAIIERHTGLVQA